MEKSMINKKEILEKIIKKEICKLGYKPKVEIIDGEIFGTMDYVWDSSDYDFEKLLTNLTERIYEYIESLSKSEGEQRRK